MKRKKRKKSTGRKRKRTIIKYSTRSRAAKTTRRRRRSNSGTVKLSLAGLKKILTPISVAMAAVGAIGARAAYGLIKQQAPDLDAKLAAVLATATAIAAGILVGKTTKHAGPVAVGALAALVLDIAGPEIAAAISDTWPAGAEAISVGMGAEPATPIITEPPPVLAGMGEMPDAYGFGEERALPDAYGFGQLDMVSVLPYM